MSLPMPCPWKHPKTGTYYLRQRVPADLLQKAKGRVVALPVDGKTYTVKAGTAVKLSLRTKDAREAKQRNREADNALQAQWQALRGKPRALTQKEIIALSGLLYHDLVARFDEEPFEPTTWQAMLSRFKAEKDTDNLTQWLGSTVDSLLAEKAINADETSRKRLLEATYAALTQAAEINLRKAEGDYSPDEKALRFPAFAEANSSERVSISALFDRWEKQHLSSGKAVSTIRRWTPVYNSFIAFVGHDDAKRVSERDVVAWKDFLLDSGKVSMTTYAGVYRAAMSTIFESAVRDWKLLDQNPFKETRAKRPKRQLERFTSFTREESTAILKAALAAPGAPGNAAERTLMTRRWVPWICAYSGARVGEIIQLRKESFETVEGVSCYWITPEAGPVKSRKPRFIPIHDHLIEQGLLDFVGEGGTTVSEPKRDRSQSGWKCRIVISGVGPRCGWRN